MHPLPPMYRVIVRVIGTMAVVVRGESGDCIHMPTYTNVRLNPKSGRTRSQLVRVMITSTHWSSASLGDACCDGGSHTCVSAYLAIVNDVTSRRCHVFLHRKCLGVHILQQWVRVPYTSKCLVTNPTCHFLEGVCCFMPFIPCGIYWFVPIIWQRHVGLVHFIQQHLLSLCIVRLFPISWFGLTQCPRARGSSSRSFSVAHHTSKLRIHVRHRAPRARPSRRPFNLWNSASLCSIVSSCRRFLRSGNFPTV